MKVSLKLSNLNHRRSHRILGPVRAVAIHPSRALLASGGDDYKIKVWGALS